MYVCIYVCMYVCMLVYIISNVLDSGNTPTKVITVDSYSIEHKSKFLRKESVEIKLYYESFCPDCRKFVTGSLVPTVEKLSVYLDIKLYPYGNAQTNETNGHYTFECQHGPAECYGNMLDACAIDLLGNITKTVFFSGCMMRNNQSGRGSDDTAADSCGKAMDIDSEPIKQCAKSNKGVQLLKFYGEESKKVGFKYVPYILINGAVNDGENFMRDICAAFNDPPPPCKQYSVSK
ncbi:hypothetical protein K1T71_001942 [Dendrolimus kikuchii]|uniref:Uncharacterized protein n=1 Tax=Dendrolimus kikuchii TaxID=765133 RepID=A0ACC1DF46_9NEOP|nr:hypothetical protein K1T71_001942 [Dendrolimus kikuchii]